MKPSVTRTLLLEQHEDIRRHLAAAEEFAIQIRIGAPIRGFEDAMLTLTRALLEHNRAEESLLEPLLAVVGDGQSSHRKIRMYEEHLGEHEIMRAALGRDPGTVAATMSELGEMLRAHMEAEERTFLHPGVLRDPPGK